MISFFKKSASFFFVIEHKNILSKEDINKLSWLLSNSKYLNKDKLLGEFIGPRKEMTTPWSTNAVEISKIVGVKSINRIERLYNSGGMKGMLWTINLTICAMIFGGSMDASP